MDFRSKNIEPISSTTINSFENKINNSLSQSLTLLVNKKTINLTLKV